ncbi:13122_t:CDS:2, partial [Gigaspora margarita]
DQALRNTSPKANKMLCTWHLIEQNLKMNCYKLFDNNDDYTVFKDKVEALCLTFNKDDIKTAMESINDTLKKSEIISLLSLALEIPMADPEFYKVFSIEALLSNSIKVPKDYFSETKCEKLKSEIQDIEAKKNKN